jgi:dTDP-L-rhamnose 4-epimerase
MSKRHQEEMCLLIGKTYNIRTVALRYFNVYGSRQAVSNPYTGACAIFAGRVNSNKRPYIFEDGKQLRDLIHVKDISKANILALAMNSANFKIINIGTGNPISILDLALLIIETYQTKIQPKISNKFRKGDIRHCYADINAAKDLLGFKASISLIQGISKFIEWAKTQGLNDKKLFEKSITELKMKKLIK